MDQLDVKIIEALTDIVLQQAKLFLEDAGEFYPFGSVIDRNRALKPVSIYWGEEFPESAEVLRKLEEIIKQGIATSDYIAAAIVVDVFIKLDDLPAGERSSALELRFYQRDSYALKNYKYYKMGSEYVFEVVRRE